MKLSTRSTASQAYCLTAVLALHSGLRQRSRPCRQRIKIIVNNQAITSVDLRRRVCIPQTAAQRVEIGAKKAAGATDRGMP